MMIFISSWKQADTLEERISLWKARHSLWFAFLSQELCLQALHVVLFGDKKTNDASAFMTACFLQVIDSALRSCLSYVITLHVEALNKSSKYNFVVIFKIIVAD